MTTIEERTMQRWDSHGFTADQARSWFESNDQPNAQLILDQSRPGQIKINND